MEAFARAAPAAQLVPRGRQPRGLAAHRRRQRRAQPLAADAALGAPASRARHAPTAYADLPEDRLALMDALRRLPVAQREAIALHHLADLPVARGRTHPRRARGDGEGPAVPGPRRPRRAPVRGHPGGRRCRTSMSSPTSPATSGTAPSRRRTSEVIRRVRARRLRTATGTMAAAVIAVGGIAVWQNAATTASPSPAPRSRNRRTRPTRPPRPGGRSSTGPTPTRSRPRAPTTARSPSCGERLEHPEPTYALVIREPDGTVHGRRLDSPVSLTPVPGGWVGLHTARAWFISSDGTWTELGAPGPTRESRPGDVLVLGQYGITVLYSPADHTLSAATLPARLRRLRHPGRPSWRPATGTGATRSSSPPSDKMRPGIARASPASSPDGATTSRSSGSATIPTAASP